MKEAKQFLDLCRRRFPSPRNDQHHSLTIHGNTLVLTLMMGDTCHRFNLSDEDLQKAPSQLLIELVTLIKAGSKAKKPDDTGPKIA